MLSVDKDVLVNIVVDSSFVQIIIYVHNPSCLRYCSCFAGITSLSQNGIHFYFWQLANHCVVLYEVLFV